MDERTDWLKQLDWEAILSTVLTNFEQMFNCRVVVDEEVLGDIKMFAGMSLSQYGLNKPNVAKIAGCFSFWFRKLKPVSYSQDRRCSFTAVNELIALILGLGICEKYKDDFSNPDFSVAAVSRRLLFDWVTSLRIHSHSPNSTVMSFELIATTDS